MSRSLNWVRVFLVVGACLLTQASIADDVLIKDVESLRRSLPRKDPSLPTLTLRLADIYFDESMDLARHLELTDAQQKSLTRYRQEALALYQEALSGDNGTFEKPASQLAFKIKFQMARLYSDMDQDKKARPVWIDLVEQTQYPDLKREAALRLAEGFEKDKNDREADKYYRMAIELCGGTDVCSYAHYKRAWLLRGQHQTEPSLAEMRLALWDSKGQVREESLRDFVLFLSTEGGDGEKALNEIEAISMKLARPQLITELSESFYSAGNKIAGTRVLEYVNSKTPMLKYQVRLMEEFYGVRQWDKFRRVADQAAQHPANTLEKADEVELEKVLRRLTVQLDGERVTQPDHATDFKSCVQLYLALFPTSKERMKMQEGWIAAETDLNVRIEQLKKWIANPALAKVDVIKLREHRANAAQKVKNNDAFLEEVSALQALVDPGEKKREYRYQQARTLYEQKNYDLSLPIFQELAQTEGVPDKWAVQSQNLALDILSQKKDYAGLMKQARLWLDHPKMKGVSQLPADVKKELADMQTVAEEAEFQAAVAGGQSPASLATFKAFCVEKKLLPKSCENARVLAIQLKDQPALLQILQLEGKTTELAAEYEASGFFDKAAVLLEKESPEAKRDIPGFLKIALLYELADKTPDQLRVLRGLVAKLAKEKSLGETEPLVFETLKVTDLFQPALLKLNWKTENRDRIAELLEERGLGTGETRKILLASKSYLGAAWAKYVMEELKKLDGEQKKIQFYGRNGKKKFDARLAALKRLTGFAEPYLQGADARTRAEMGKLLADSHHEIVTEIENSPIPEGLPEEAVVQVKASIQEVANPFKEKALAYDKIVTEQTALIAQSGAARAAVAKVESSARAKALEELHANPQNNIAIGTLRDFYESQGQARLSLYFKGRLLQQQKEGNGT